MTRPTPRRVRAFMDAYRVADAEVDWSYPYSEAQLARVRRCVRDRARWLAIVGPRSPRTYLTPEQRAFSLNRIERESDS